MNRDHDARRCSWSTRDILTSSATKSNRWQDFSNPSPATQSPSTGEPHDPYQAAPRLNIQLQWNPRQSPSLQLRFMEQGSGMQLRNVWSGKWSGIRWMMPPSATHSKGPTFADTPAPGAHLSSLSSSPLFSRWDYLFLNGIPLIYHVNTMASTFPALGEFSWRHGTRKDLPRKDLVSPENETQTYY